MIKSHTKGTSPMPTPASKVRAGRLIRSLALALVTVGGLAACSSDDQSAQDQYCDAGESLRSNVDALLSLDVVSEGTDGITSAVNAVEDSFDDLSDSASDAASDATDALDDALNDLESALSAVGDDLTSENATSVVDAIGAVQTAAGDVYATLTDC
ncbi:MAG: hypothetical protein ACN4GZ_06075 [Acidimicrobiales bacterium]